MGNNSAPSMRISPGASDWYHGEALTETRTAQPKPSSGPAMNEFQKSLSVRMCAFFVPMRETSSIVCWGVKASIVLGWSLSRQATKLGLDHKSTFRGQLAAYSHCISLIYPFIACLQIAWAVVGKSRCISGQPSGTAGGHRRSDSDLALASGMTEKRRRWA